MENFDWVTARELCSAIKVFEQIKLEIKDDVDTRNKLITPKSAYIFRFLANNDRYTVLKEGDRIYETVTFELADQLIHAKDKNDKILLEASLTLNDEGECRLKINDQERELWQFRKMALERLFF